MIADVLTVMWKERKGLFRARGSRLRFVLLVATPLILAIQLPWQAGATWTTSYPSLLLAGIIPLVLVGTTIPDAFAGERERNTLATLLASRLPDRAMLVGKLAVSLAFAWGATVAVLLVSLVTFNVTHWDGRLRLYRPTVALADLAISLLIALLIAGVGVLVSLRAATVQEATQTLMAGFLLPPMILGVVLTMFPDRVREVVGGLDTEQALLLSAAVLVLVDTGALALALARFRRARLLLA